MQMPAERSVPESASPEDRLTLGEVVARTGVPASALYFYEREGLIFAERSAGNQRLYRRYMLRRVALILVAKRLGIRLGDVAAIFATLPTDRAPSHLDWERVSRSWKRELEGRRRYIENLEHQLVGCIGCGCLSMRACGLLNPGDGLGKRGQGPVRLDEASR
ncbi:redox-sensitive transcriptional activator SoxR [Micromonospora sp. NPDC050397]|uniref:redox-sensitive transcriptional activator SoxR n=1 Tax=Micromonospora sp. NPDC050397 TaxID=3364279 RepID=UPI00384FC6BE